MIHDPPSSCNVLFVVTKLYKKKKRQSSPITGLEWPRGFQEVKVGGKVVSLMHRPPLPLGNAPGTHFC